MIEVQFEVVHNRRSSKHTVLVDDDETLQFQTKTALKPIIQAAWQIGLVRTVALEMRMPITIYAANGVIKDVGYQTTLPMF